MYADRKNKLKIETETDTERKADRHKGRKNERGSERDRLKEIGWLRSAANYSNYPVG